MDSRGKELVKKFKSLLYLIVPGLVLMSCGQAGSSKENGWAVGDGFADYWYQGKAEISSYQLEQARYGAMHDGKAVLIFVTEDFSEKKHVKLDNPSEAGNDAVKVLKLNLLKKFNTGIYPYSMMSSVFTPVNHQEYPHSLKITTTSQEWCGHTFTQLNLDGNKINAYLYSYFESEGDQQVDLKAALLEDEIWNLIRLNPEMLPTGSIKIIPGTMYQRLSHKELKVEEATAALRENGKEAAYILNYPGLERTLQINFEKDFPHKITAWEETYMSGFGKNAKKLTSRAVLDKTIMTDYWTQNLPEDSVLRKELNLE